MLRPIVLLGIFLKQTIGLELDVVNQWNLLEYNFPFDNGQERDFRPENTVFTGLEITHERLFLAMPRLRTGVPATLATIPRDVALGSSPVLQAYPDWSFHEAGKANSTPSCNGLISVYRIRMDSCNRLWVLDSGIMNSLEEFKPICSPKLVVFDLTTDQIVRTVVFPREVLRPNSLLTNLVIDESVQGTCDSAFVYMSDTASPGIVTYDGRRDAAWRHIHPTMFPDPNFSDYTINGERFTLMDGIVGITHSPKMGLFYYQPLATDRIFSIPTEILRKGPPAENEELPITLVGKKASQGLGLAVNKLDDTLYFSPLTETSVASWNPLSNHQRLLAYDPRLLQFPAEVRWADIDGNVWLLSTRFQKFFRRTISPHEVNLRVIRIQLSPRITTRLNDNDIFF